MGKTLFYRKADLPPSAPPEVSECTLHSFVSRLIRDYYGELPSSVDVAKLSTFHYVFHVTVGSGECFVKIAKSKRTRRTLRLEHFLYEEILKELNIGVGAIGCDISYKRYPFPFLILSKARGVCLRSIDFSVPFYQRLMRNLGTKVAGYHSIIFNGGGFGLIDEDRLEKDCVIRGRCGSWEEYLVFNLEEHLSFAREWSAIDAEEENVIRSLFDARSGLWKARPPSCLLHGDLGSHNIFVNTSSFEVKSIVDWEDALLGDPLFDIAMWASFYRMHEYLESFLEGYTSARLINDDKYLLKIWAYYLRIALSKSVLRFKLGYDPRGQSKSAPKIKRAIEKIKSLGVL